MLFRDLSLPAQSVYHVTRRIKNHKTNSFFHGVETIAEKTGLSARSVQKALRELTAKGILQATERSGHTTLYTFISTADIDEVCTPPEQNLHPTPAYYAPITTRALTNRDLTTTVTWLNSSLKDQLIKTYGIDEVEKRVVVISKMNGKIKNKAGLLRHSLQNNYIPDSKELREKEEAEEKNKAIEKEIERNREQLKQWEAESQQSQNINISEMFSQFILKKNSPLDS